MVETQLKQNTDYAAENAHLRKLLREYEERNASLKIDNSKLRMKIESIYSEDGDAEFQAKQAKLKLKQAERKVVSLSERVYKIDKAEALVKYWQKQNYDREQDLKGTIFKYDQIIKRKNTEMKKKDELYRLQGEALDFQREKAKNLEVKLTKAEDKIVILEKENVKLTQQMNALKKACEQQLVAMKKKCDRDLKIADLKAKKNLRKVAKFAEKKFQELVQVTEQNIGVRILRIKALKEKTDTAYMARIKKLIAVINKLKREASHVYARINAAEDLKQAEIDIDNLERALEKEQKEHLDDNLKNEAIIEEKERMIAKLEFRIEELKEEVQDTILAAKAPLERAMAEVFDWKEKYTDKCAEFDELAEVLRLVRKKAKEDAEIAEYEIHIRDLEIKRLNEVIDDLNRELVKRKKEIEDLSARLKVAEDECERRHQIILAKIKEIGRLEEVVGQVAEKARADAIKAAAILKHTRKVLKETQEHVERLKKALAEAIEFGRQQTKKLNIALQTIKEKDSYIYKKEVEIVNLNHDVKEGIEENLNLEWKLNKRKQLDAEKNRTIDKQRVEIQELRSALEAIERRIRTNNAKVTRMRAQVRAAEDRLLRVQLLLEQKTKEHEDFKEKSKAEMDAAVEKWRILERNYRKELKDKQEEFNKFKKFHLDEMKANDLRELKLQDKLDTAVRRRKNATERRKFVETEMEKLLERLRLAEAEAHAFKLQRLRIEQAEALAKLGKYIGLEAREQTLNRLQRRLAETRDYLERERALTRETVQELAGRNTTLMVQVRKLAASLKGARTEQAKLLSTQLQDVSNYSNHLINRLDESELLEMRMRNRLPEVSSRTSAGSPGRGSTMRGSPSRGSPRSGDEFGLGEVADGEALAAAGAVAGEPGERRPTALERLLATTPYKDPIPRAKYTDRPLTADGKTRRPKSSSGAVQGAPTPDAGSIEAGQVNVLGATNFQVHEEKGESKEAKE